MEVDPRTGLATSSGVTEEMMACPLPRVPFVTPGTEPDDVKPLYEAAIKMWGTVPRYLQLMAHAPAGVEAWTLLDQKLRIDRLATEPDYVVLEELVIIKTSLMNGCNN
jgi:hypothetical protein